MHNLVVLLFPLPCLFSFPHLSLFCPLWFPYCCHLTWSHVSPLYLNTSNPVPHFCFLDLCPQSYPHRHTYITNKNLVPPHKREHALLVFATLTHYNNFQNCFFLKTTFFMAKNAPLHTYFPYLFITWWPCGPILFPYYCKNNAGNKNMHVSLWQRILGVDAHSFSSVFTSSRNLHLAFPRSLSYSHL